jgi:hypothetical protein
MGRGDEVLTGLFIGGISLCTVVAFGYYIRNRCKKPTLKQPPSHEDLVVVTEDPQPN